MHKSFFAIIATAASVVTLSATAVQAGDYPFGDPPYRLDYGWNEPQIEQGCWKWNWQQYQWNDHCPTYIRPKAYMYPRAVGTVLRTRG